MWLYSFTNHYMILSTNKLESVSNTTAWLLVLCSTFFIIIIVLESHSNYLSHSNSNYFHEDVALFKSSIISIKYVFISWKYSSTKGALNYVLPSLLNWDFGIFFPPLCILFMFVFKSNKFLFNAILLSFYRFWKINNQPIIASIFSLMLSSSTKQPNLRELLTVLRKCKDSRCEYCYSLLLLKVCTFKNVNITFTLKTQMSCNSFNVSYVFA